MEADICGAEHHITFASSCDYLSSERVVDGHMVSGILIECKDPLAVIVRSESTAAALDPLPTDALETAQYCWGGASGTAGKLEFKPKGVLVASWATGEEVC